MASDFGRAANYLLDPKNAPQIVKDYESYFDSYTGPFFEEFIARSDPNRFTSEDLGALACLSVELRGEAVVELLIERADELNELLTAPGVPDAGADLRTVDPAAIAGGAPLSVLYERLKSIKGISYVRASKLLAAKRPALVPVRDNVVADFLGAGEAWWAPYRDLVSESDVADKVYDLSQDIPERVSLLRRVDIALWMAGKRS